MLDKIWVTRDLRAIPVSKMTTSHIKNAIAMIERSKKGWRASFLPRLRLELTIRDLPGR